MSKLHQLTKYSKSATYVHKSHRNFWVASVTQTTTYTSPANNEWRKITHECVHLVRCGYFWSRDKDGGHIIRSTIDKNPRLHADCTAPISMFYRTGVIAIEVCDCWDRDFGPWPWPDNLHIQTWPVLPGDIPDVQKWTSYVKAFESYCLTDAHRQTRLKLGMWRIPNPNPNPTESDTFSKIRNPTDT